MKRLLRAAAFLPFVDGPLLLPPPIVENPEGAALEPSATHDVAVLDARAACLATGVLTGRALDCPEECLFPPLGRVAERRAARANARQRRRNDRKSRQPGIDQSEAARYHRVQTRVRDNKAIRERIDIGALDYSAQESVLSGLRILGSALDFSSGVAYVEHLSRVRTALSASTDPLFLDAVKELTPDLASVFYGARAVTWFPGQARLFLASIVKEANTLLAPLDMRLEILEGANGDTCMLALEPHLGRILDAHGIAPRDFAQKAGPAAPKDQIYGRTSGINACDAATYHAYLDEELFPSELNQRPLERLPQGGGGVASFQRLTFALGLPYAEPAFDALSFLVEQEHIPSCERTGGTCGPRARTSEATTALREKFEPTRGTPSSTYMSERSLLTTHQLIDWMRALGRRFGI